MTSTTRRRVTAATLALGAGAAALGILAAPAAQAAPMTFAQACTTTHGWVDTVVTAGIEQCRWQDSDGNEWIRKSPIGAPAQTAPGNTPFAQACVVTQGWNAIIPAAGIEQCHWQDSDGNEHLISSKLPKKPPLQLPTKIDQATRAN
jgi:uncharacterized protein YodC (DUF2158 family)